MVVIGTTAALGDGQLRMAHSPFESGSEASGAEPSWCIGQVCVLVEPAHSQRCSPAANAAVDPETRTTAVRTATAIWLRSQPPATQPERCLIHAITILE